MLSMMRVHLPVGSLASAAYPPRSSASTRLGGALLRNPDPAYGSGPDLRMWQISRG